MRAGVPAACAAAAVVGLLLAPPVSAARRPTLGIEHVGGGAWAQGRSYRIDTPALQTDFVEVSEGVSVESRMYLLDPELLRLDAGITPFRRDFLQGGSDESPWGLWLGATLDFLPAGAVPIQLHYSRSQYDLGNAYGRGGAQETTRMHGSVGVVSPTVGSLRLTLAQFETQPLDLGGAVVLVEPMEQRRGTLRFAHNATAFDLRATAEAYRLERGDYVAERGFVFWDARTRLEDTTVYFSGSAEGAPMPSSQAGAAGAGYQGYYFVAHAVNVGEETQTTGRYAFSFTGDGLVGASSNNASAQLVWRPTSRLQLDAGAGATYANGLQAGVWQPALVTEGANAGALYTGSLLSLGYSASAQVGAGGVHVWLPVEEPDGALAPDRVRCGGALVTGAANLLLSRPLGAGLFASTGGHVAAAEDASPVGTSSRAASATAQLAYGGFGGTRVTLDGRYTTRAADANVAAVASGGGGDPCTAAEESSFGRSDSASGFLSVMSSFGLRLHASASAGVYTVRPDVSLDDRVGGTYAYAMLTGMPHHSVVLTGRINVSRQFDAPSDDTVVLARADVRWSVRRFEVGGTYLEDIAPSRPNVRSVLVRLERTF